MAEQSLYVGNPQRPSRVVFDPCDIDQPILAKLLLYWRDRCKSGAVPQFSDFSPRDFARDLGSMIVTEADGDDFRYRLVGTRVTRYFLSDATGKTIREEFGGDLGEFLTRLNQQSCNERIPIRLTGPAATIDEVLFPDYDTLYLPWAKGGTVNKVMSVFVFDSLAARDTGLAETSALKLASADDLIR